jgi:tetratricopeptide (TPR) repeat protein
VLFRSDAIEHYQAALQLQPNNAQTLANLAISYADAGNTQLAIPTGEKAIDAARSQNLTDLAQETETWLAKLRTEHPTQQGPAKRSGNSP